MKKTLIALALTAPLLASATNLLSNGSFEDNLASWLASNSAGVTYPAAVIAYGPWVAFGEAVPVDNAASLSSDAAAAHAVYFVDDNNTQSLSQVFNVLTAGDYMAGFSVYGPANGLANPDDASFSLTINGSPVAQSTVAALGPTSWAPLSGGLISRLDRIPLPSTSAPWVVCPRTWSSTAPMSPRRCLSQAVSR